MRGGRSEQRDGSVRARRRDGRIGNVSGLGEVHVAVDETGQQPAALEIDDRVLGVGSGRRDERGDAIAVDTDVGADEPLPGGVQHQSSRQPAHLSIPPDPPRPAEFTYRVVKGRAVTPWAMTLNTMVTAIV